MTSWAEIKDPLAVLRAPDADAVLEAIEAAGLCIAQQQDAEDGRALRELRAALPPGRWLELQNLAVSWLLTVRDKDRAGDFTGLSIAAACDRARAALERRP